MSKDTELTNEHIVKYIEAFKLQHLPRLLKLDRYYKGDNDIRYRTFKDPTKPNNKISHSWGNYITDSMTAFFMGEPVSYSGKNDEDIKKINSVFNQNNEQDVNSELAKHSSIFGAAYELMYLDETDSKNVRFTALSPLNVIPIYDDTIDNNLLYVIRPVDTFDIIEDKVNTTVWVYDDSSTTSYKLNDDDTLEELDEVPHNFNDIPVSVYLNNDDAMGDFESVIDLIDFYDVLESDTANAFEYFNDCYLVIEGANILDEELLKMKESRVIDLPEDADVRFLLKEANDVEQENTKNRTINDIHKFSKVPNMSDEHFANNVSGVAMRYKLLGLENACSIKERKFKNGLQNRLRLISHITSIKSGENLQEIDITFTRNIPNNEIEIAEMINNLRGIASDETLLEQLSFIESAKEELERRNEEKGSTSLYDSLFDTKEDDIDAQEVLGD